MRFDIPYDEPRRREIDNTPKGSHENSPLTRKLPENPIHQHLKSPARHGADHRQPHVKRRQDAEPAQEIPRERRRPISTDARRPARVASNVVGVELRPEEKRLLHEAGRFRVVRTADLRESLYNGKARQLENDLRYLRDKGLIETAHVNLRRDGVRRSIERIEVVTLTKDGRNLLLRTGEVSKGQKVYDGLVKPREVEHDSQIYRAYQKEAERIAERGGTNLRVKLDYELKADVQKAIYREHKADPSRDMADIKKQVAEEMELPFVDGKIQIPDARIEYDLPRDVEYEQDQEQSLGSRTGHEDIEVLTAAYHAGHLRSKAQAGFRNYASRADRSAITSRIEDDHGLMEDILEL